MKFIVTNILLFFFCSVIHGQIVINEIISSNKTVWQNATEETPDIIELFNTSASAINLSGYYLTDDETLLDKWTFPDVEIPAKGFLLIEAYGEDATLPLQANFKISADGEPIILNYQGTIVDNYEPVELLEDESFGRTNDGNSTLVKLTIPTPGFSNNINNQLSFSHNSGFYLDSILLEVNKLFSGQTIRYTTNGNTPNDSSALWSENITFYKNESPNNYCNIETSPGFYAPTSNIFKIHALRFAVFQDTIRTSPVYNRSYIIDNNFEHNRYNYPIFSIITDSLNLFDYDTGIYVPGIHFVASNKDWTGNYFQSGDEWERQAHLTLFNNGQSIELDQNVGVRIHGGRKRYSRVKTLRMYARKEYGKKSFETQLFPNSEKESYKRFIIRNPHGCWNGTVIKDVLTHHIVRDFNFEKQDLQPSIVFINGEYWGMHTIRDYLGKHHFSSLYDIDKDSLHILNTANHFIDEGSDSAYVALIDFMTDNSVSFEGNYDYVNSQIDIANFIDYEIAEIFFNNYDWPYGNTKYWRNRGQGQGQEQNKWRWAFFDIDAGWGHKGASYNMLNHATTLTGSSTKNPPHATFLLRELLTNENFKNQFIDRFSCLLNSRFQPDTLVDYINEIKALYQPGIAEQTHRWKIPASEGSWNSKIGSVLTNFAQSRRNYMIEHIRSHFNLPNYSPEDYCKNTSITEQVKVDVHTYPNPFSDMLNISTSKPFISVELINQFGQIVLTGTDTQLNTTHLASGVYLLKVNFEQHSVTQKLVKL